MSRKNTKKNAAELPNSTKTGLKGHFSFFSNCRQINDIYSVWFFFLINESHLSLLIEGMFNYHAENGDDSES
jgi:hypothetical protein